MNPMRSAHADGSGPGERQASHLDPGHHRRMIVIAECGMGGVEPVVRLVVAKTEVARTEEAQQARTRRSRSRAHCLIGIDASLLRGRERRGQDDETAIAFGNPSRATCRHAPRWSTIITSKPAEASTPTVGANQANGPTA